MAALEFTGLGGRIMATQARALSCLGDFHLSQQSAEAVLRLDPRCVQAVWIRAESLYNNCQFERAMSVFCRGLRYTIFNIGCLRFYFDPFQKIYLQRFSPGFEGFVTGIAKCRKTIQTALNKDDVFEFQGSSLLLEKLRAEMRRDPDTIERMIAVGKDEKTGK